MRYLRPARGAPRRKKVNNDGPSPEFGNGQHFSGWSRQRELRYRTAQIRGRRQDGHRRQSRRCSGTKPASKNEEQRNPCERYAQIYVHPCINGTPLRRGVEVHATHRKSLGGRNRSALPASRGPKNTLIGQPQAQASPPALYPGPAPSSARSSGQWESRRDRRLRTSSPPPFYHVVEPDPTEPGRPGTTRTSCPAWRAADAAWGPSCRPSFPWLSPASSPASRPSTR